MLRRIIVIGTKVNTDSLFSQLESLSGTAARANNNAPILFSTFAFRELTLTSGKNKYSFQRFNPLPNSLCADLCIACDADDSTRKTLDSMVSKCIPFIPVCDMTINDLLVELNDRFALSAPETTIIPTERVVIQKTLGQKAAAAASKTASSAADAVTTSAASAADAANDIATSLVHSAALFVARIEVAKAPAPLTPDVHGTIGNAQL